jgi:transposase
MKESLQYLIGVDKRNPHFSLYRNTEKGEIHVFFGAVLFEVIKDEKDSMELKLMIARLYNAKVSGKSLIEHFGYSYPTIQRWGDAVKSGDPEKLLQALSGQGAIKKFTPEILAFVVNDFAHIYSLNKYSYSQEIREDIKKIFGVDLCAETLRPVLGKLKDAYKNKGKLTAEDKKKLLANLLSQ